MVRSAEERKQSEEERERLLRQLQQQFGQAADLIDVVQKRLCDSEEERQLLDALLEYIPERITIASAGEDKIRMVSKYSQHLIGWPREVLEGLSLQEYARKWVALHLDGVTPMTEEELPIIRATRQGEVVTDEEWLICRPDGRTIRVLSNAGPIRNHRDEIIGGVVAWRDITERQRTEEALAHLAAIVDSSEDAIFSHSLDGIILTWNPAAERLYGYSAEEILGQPIFLFVPADRSGELRDILKRIQQGERIASHETVRVRKDGSLVEVSVSVAPIKETELEPAIVIAMKRFEEFQALRHEAADLRQALEDRKVIERAKGIIMRRAKLEEAEAFRRLQHLATCKSRKLVEIAQMIVVAEEAFQAVDRSGAG